MRSSRARGRAAGPTSSRAAQARHLADTVLVTGISGFIGGHVARALLDAGYRVRGSLRSLNRADEVRAMLAKATASGTTDRLEFVDPRSQRRPRVARGGGGLPLSPARRLALHHRAAQGQGRDDRPRGRGDAAGADGGARRRGGARRAHILDRGGRLRTSAGADRAVHGGGLEQDRGRRRHRLHRIEDARGARGVDGDGVVGPARRSRGDQPARGSRTAARRRSGRLGGAGQAAARWVAAGRGAGLYRRSSMSATSRRSISRRWRRRMRAGTGIWRRRAICR